VRQLLLLFVGGSLGLWALAAYPAYRLWGESALVYSSVALAICLIPTAATLAWARWAVDQSPEQQLLMVLGGTGARMGTVLLAGLLFYLNAPYPQERQAFWVWLLVFYLFSLAFETVLMVKGRQMGSNRKAGSASTAAAD